MTLTLHRDVPPLLGLVMVGGKSSRMQRAKAHLVIHDVPQWHYCETVLRSVVDDVYFSVSPQLSPPLTTRSDRLIEDCFREPIGPLGGIISAFRRFPDHALFVLACDLPYFVAAAAEYLVAMRNDRRLASVFTDEKGLVEPLCGIYEPAIKTELARAWAENRFCPRGILSNLDVKKVATPEQTWLTNLNHAHELADFAGAGLRVTVFYYASLREKAGVSSETVTTSMLTVGSLYDELKTRYGFNLDVELLRFAQNDTLVSHDAVLSDNASVVFIPPVSGG